ncbi:type II methionyl aminopeptidase [Candidatus Woesearchaeota archaeon]|nr:type II methionyl aminopeptidase [Candidatus Woesearchaeota archaeon]
MIEKEIMDKYRKAGMIAKKSLLYGKELIRKGASMLDVTNKIEAKIFELGGKPAFPVQISCNEIAAHYCAITDDPLIFNDQLCCLDVGVHVDGYIGDNACSVDLSGKNSDLIRASEEALRAATEVLALGVKISSIGKAIENAITGMGFKPVKNLSGHGLSRYGVHAPPAIPNFDTKSNEVLEEGFIAIEPFATDGSGMIHEKGKASVCEMIGKKSVRTGFVRDIQKEIDSFNGLPFCTRWLLRKYSYAQVNFAMMQFRQLGILREYPPLVERGNGLVSQAENSFYIGKEIIQITNPYL